MESVCRMSSFWERINPKKWMNNKVSKEIDKLKLNKSEKKYIDEELELRIKG